MLQRYTQFVFLYPNCMVVVHVVQSNVQNIILSRYLLHSVKRHHPWEPTRSIFSREILVWAKTVQYSLPYLVMGAPRGWLWLFVKVPLNVAFDLSKPVVLPNSLLVFSLAKFLSTTPLTHHRPVPNHQLTPHAHLICKEFLWTLFFIVFSGKYWSAIGKSRIAIVTSTSFWSKTNLGLQKWFTSC